MVHNFSTYVGLILSQRKITENNFFLIFNEVHTHAFGYRFAHIVPVSTESKKGVSVYNSLELVL